MTTLGAGDCFASTFTAAMIKFDWDIVKSVKYAAANSANLVQHFGGQEGIKNFDELDKFINQYESGDIKVVIQNINNGKTQLVK